MQSCGSQSYWVHLQNTPHLRLIEHCRRGGGRTVRTRASGVWCGSVSAGNIRSYTHEVLPTQLSKHELNKANNGQAKVDKGEPVQSQPFPENYKQLRDAKSGRNRLLHGRVHQMTNITNGQPWKHA